MYHFHGPVYCSTETALVAPIVLRDAAHQPLRSGITHAVTSDVTVRLRPAGHILDSSTIEPHAGDRPRPLRSMEP
jgi:Cft2 family RNA processing exonuclease